MNREWTARRLADVTLATETATPQKQPNAEFDYIDVSSVSNTSLEIRETQTLLGKQAPSRARRRVCADDVLFATIRPTLKRIAMIPAALHDAICSTGFIVLRANADLLPRFLFYFLQTDAFISSMEGLQKGTSYPAVTDGDVRNQVVPVPPLPEQRRIVAILDEAFEGIAAAKAKVERNLRNATAIADAAAQALLADASSDAVDTTIGAEVDLLAGFAFKSRGYTAAIDGVRLLRGDNIVPGGLRWEDVKRWPKAEADEYQRFALAENDVVLAMDRPLIGAGLKRSRITKSDLPCLLVQRVARLRAKHGLDSGFLYHLLGTQRFIGDLLDGQTGTGVPHISGKQIADHAFARPSLEDQRRAAIKIDALLDNAGELQSAVANKLTALDELKASLLHQAFTGQL